MKGGTVLRIARDIIALVDSKGLITPEGDFVTPTPVQDAELAVGVEAILTAYGVVVPDKVDKIVKLLPLLVATLGTT